MDKPEISIIVINGNTAEPMEFTAGGTTVKVNVTNSVPEQPLEDDFYTNQVDSFFEAMCDLPPEEESYWELCQERDKTVTGLNTLVGENEMIKTYINRYEALSCQVERCASESFYRRGFREGMRFVTEAMGRKK